MFETRTQSDEMRLAVLAILARSYDVDESRMTFSFQGLSRRTSSTPNSVTMTITISPPTTINTQYGLSCAPPVGTSSCNQAQAALQAVGVSSDSCTLTGGVLRTVVWGDDNTIQNTLVAYCTSTALLTTLGTQFTASELVGLLQQLEASGSMNIAINGLVFIPSNSTSSASVVTPQNPSTDSSTGGSGGMMFAGAGAGGAVLVIIIVAAVILSRRKSSLKTPPGSSHAMPTRRDSRLGGRAVVNPMFYETDLNQTYDNKASVVHQNPLFDGEEGLYHDSARMPGNDGGYLDMSAADSAANASTSAALDQRAPEAAINNEPYENVREEAEEGNALPAPTNNLPGQPTSEEAEPEHYQRANPGEQATYDSGAPSASYCEAQPASYYSGPEASSGYGSATPENGYATVTTGESTYAQPMYSQADQPIYGETSSAVHPALASLPAEEPLYDVE